MRKGIVAMVKIVLGVSDVHNSDNENLFARLCVIYYCESNIILKNIAFLKPFNWQVWEVTSQVVPVL